MSRNRAELKEWLKERRITEVELLVPDMAGIARGKILPTSKFLSGLDNDTLRLPESVFGQMVTGADADTESLTYQAPDMILVPDADTICVVPWYREPTAQVICDCVDRKESPNKVAPRQVLKDLLANLDLQPFMRRSYACEHCQRNLSDPTVSSSLESPPTLRFREISSRATARLRMRRLSRPSRVRRRVTSSSLAKSMGLGRTASMPADRQ